MSKIHEITVTLNWNITSPNTSNLTWWPFTRCWLFLWWLINLHFCLSVLSCLTCRDKSSDFNSSFCFWQFDTMIINPPHQTCDQPCYKYTYNKQMKLPSSRRLYQQIWDENTQNTPPTTMSTKFNARLQRSQKFMWLSRRTQQHHWSCRVCLYFLQNTLTGRLLCLLS